MGYRFAFLLKILGLIPSPENAERLAWGLKKMRLGDLFELTLTEELELQAAKEMERYELPEKEVKS